jgi:transposase
VRQRAQLINALRGHLSEHRVAAPQGPANVKVLAAVIDDEGTTLPMLVVELSRVFLGQIEALSQKIAILEQATAREATQGAPARRLQTMPGVGPITALAIETFAPPMAIFKRGRDFAAWLGLVPRQHSTGGKQVLGKISKLGQRDIRRLLIIGAMAVVRWASRKGAPEGGVGCTACWRANHAYSLQLHLPIGWLVQFGPCLRRARITGFPWVGRSNQKMDYPAEGMLGV